MDDAEMQKLKWLGVFVAAVVAFKLFATWGTPDFRLAVLDIVCGSAIAVLLGAYVWFAWFLFGRTSPLNAPAPPPAGSREDEVRRSSGEFPSP